MATLTTVSAIFAQSKDQDAVAALSTRPVPSMAFPMAAREERATRAQISPPSPRERGKKGTVGEGAVRADR